MLSRTLFAGVIALVGCTWLAAPNAMAPVPAPPVSLDIPGRADATPWVAASGSFVAVAWGATAGGKTDVFLAVSRDGGSTFAAPVQVNTVAGEARLGGELPPRVTLTARRGSAVPEIAVLWTARGKATEIKVARSTDGGRTFGRVATLQSPGAAGDRGWPSVAFDRQARVHAVWLDHRGLAANRAAGAAHAGHQAGAQHDGVAMAQKSGLYYASPASTGSRTRERQLAKGVCYCCKTALAVGSDGSLYTAWRHVYPGDLRDMAFAVSRDGGRSFSAPLRVNEDRWAINGCPDDGPAMAVEGSTVHLTWPTVVQGANPQGVIYYASTRDGRRFSSPVRVPTLGGLKPTHPQIVATSGGRIFVAWEEGVNGQRIAAAREVRLQPGRAPAFGDVITLSADRATYPVLAATDRGLVAVWVTGSADQSRVEAMALTPR